MKTSLSALTAVLVAGAMHIQPTQADLQTRPAPGFSAPAPAQSAVDQSPAEERLEERLREGFYGSGSEEWREEKVREDRRARGHCNRIANPIEREGCLDDLK